MMAVDSDKIRSLADQMTDIAKKSQAKVPTSKQAVVVSLDGDTTWVEFSDATEQTPVERSTVRCQVGDVVTVQIVDGSAIITGNLSEKSVGSSTVNAAVAPVSAEITSVRKLVADSAKIADLEATNARIGTLEVEKANVTDLNATNAKVESLDASKASMTDLEATNAKVTNLEATKASVKDLEAESARITELDAAKADIDLANVNNAWIQNGTIKDASISDAQILGVSANKLTAGTIDAAKIKVTNLNADNITVGTINGKLIGNESIDLDKLSQEVPTKKQLDDAKEELQGQIDGNIETFTVSAAPTLGNEPAKGWADDATRKKHVGDVAYVVNKSSAQDGYAYRFGYDETSKTYSWVLIKDNDVTAALKRISEAEGNIDGLKSFETSTSKWIDETDEGLTQVRSRTTSLETQMGDKVSTTTFKELSDTVDGQASTITTMSDTLSTKADGSTVTSLSQTVNQVKQTAEGNSTKLSSLSKTVDTKADGSTVTELTNTVSQVQQSLDGFESTVSTTYETKADATSKRSALETSIKQTNDAVALKAAKTDLDAATKRISAAETSIKANADSISLKASKTEVPGLVSVGGRNLYVGSKDYQTGLWLNLNRWVNDGTYEGLVVKSKTDTWSGLTQRLHVNKGDILTFSAWAKVESGGDIVFVNYTAESNDRTGQKYIGGIDHPSSYRWVTSSEDGTEWRRIHAVIEMTEDRTLAWRVENSIPDKKLSVCGLKLEKGNVPTAWTPAPEDVQSDISTAKQAAIDVSAEAIKGFVKSAGGETSYKQTDSGFTWTTTSPMTAVSDATARKSASDAETAANNAATVASNAATTASKAQTTADGANTAAGEAKTLANSANSIASAAKTTADSASTTASEAKTAAATAATKATAFMDYNETESGKLTIGYRSGEAISTVRAALSNAALEFKNTAGTVLASFGATQAQVGASTSKNVLVTSVGVYLRAGADNLLSMLADRIEMLGGKMVFGAKNLSERTLNGMYSAGNIAIMSEATENSGKAGVVEVGEGSASMNIDGEDKGIGINRQDDGSVSGSVNVDRLYFGTNKLQSGTPKVGMMQITHEASGTDSMYAARSATDTTYGGTAGTRHCIKFGVGAGGINRGIYDDAFNRWVIYWDNDTCKRPIIPGLYTADYSSSSLKPSYSGYTTSKELAAGGSTSGTLSYSLSGYGALGIIGTDVSQCSYPAHTLVNAWVTDRKNGSAIIHYTIKNTTASSKNTVKVRFHVLVAKQ